MKIVRRLFQVLVVLAVIYLAAGWGERSFEHFCPFGGMESLFALATSRTITCAISPWNFAVFFAVLGLTLASKKSFCGWICPVGFMYELLAKIQVRLFRKKTIPPVGIDRWLRLLRYVVLIVVLFFTWKSGELVFRGYDPYYLVFSGMGHGTVGTLSVLVIIILLVSGLLIKMSWCRYFCPMSAVMDGFSVPSILAVKRDSDRCTECRSCDDSCEHDLRPSQRRVVVHRDCTNCLNCLEACPEAGCLTLTLNNRFRRIEP
ncbi:4Fe-4S binding protein [Acidobacteriota bacterium]